MAASSGSGDENNNAAAYNASIYLMVSVPYLSLTVVGFLIYRGVKKNADFLQSQQSGDRDQGPAEPSS